MTTQNTTETYSIEKINVRVELKGRRYIKVQGYALLDNENNSYISLGSKFEGVIIPTVYKNSSVWNAALSMGAFRPGFDLVPKSDDDQACPVCNLIEGCHVSGCINDTEITNQFVG